MTRPSHDPSADPEPCSALDELVFECLERMEREGAAALEALSAAHPDQAEALAARLRALGSAGLLQPDDERFPERLGEFRLEERLGRGGMGVVYRAEQTSLGRDVALKLIRPEQLYFPGARERFRREVEAVARLAHPGIVPVYVVGEEAGVPYFAMELVHGASLEDVLLAFRGRAPAELRGTDLFRLVARLARERGATESERPEERVFAGTWTQACLWIAREVAQALEHAHQRGVLHRDVKPSNVMLTPGGRTLLLDFGLASTESAARLTRTGSQTGSLPYMAPEQVRGGAAQIDARTDVYGLGVTLYEMLALGPPFSAAGSAELSRRILEARPERLRRRVVGLGADVETVVATAMAPERAGRYASAADLARDLSNLLERRPILARPAGMRVRALRWVQRRPAAATALVMGLAIVVGGPLVYGLQERAAARQERRLGVELARQRDEARAQGERAEANFEKALAAVDDMLTGVGDQRLADVPRAADVRRQLLEEALSFYQGFLAERPDDPRLAAEVVRAELRCGRVLTLLGRFPEAEQAFTRTLEGLRAGTGTFAPGERAQLSGEASLGLARRQLDSDRSAAAEATLRTALSALEEEEDRPDAVQGLRAELRGILAEVLQATGREDEAEAELCTQRDELEALVAGPDATEQERRDLAHTLTTLGSGDLAGARSADAGVAFTRALELFEDLSRAHPDEVDLQADLARTHVQLATVAGAADPDATERHADAALALLESLSSDYPELPRLQHDLAAALVAAASTSFERQDLATASAENARALSLMEGLVAQHPDVAEYRASLATAESDLFAVLLGQGETEKAIAALDRADEELAHCLASEPGRPELVELQTVLRVNRGYALLALGRHRDAVAAVTPLPDWPRWREHMSAAVVCLRALDQLAADSSLSEDESAALEERYVTRALELVRESVHLGFGDANDLRTSPQWAALRDLPEFDDLVAAAEAQHKSGAAE